VYYWDMGFERVDHVVCGMWYVVCGMWYVVKSFFIPSSSNFTS
jgi:hypothetical protein